MAKMSSELRSTTSTTSTNSTNMTTQHAKTLRVNMSVTPGTVCLMTRLKMVNLLALLIIVLIMLIDNTGHVVIGQEISSLLQQLQSHDDGINLQREGLQQAFRDISKGVGGGGSGALLSSNLSDNLKTQRQKVAEAFSGLNEKLSEGGSINLSEVDLNNLSILKTDIFSDSKPLVDLHSKPAAAVRFFSSSFGGAGGAAASAAAELSSAVGRVGGGGGGGDSVVGLPPLAILTTGRSPRSSSPLINHSTKTNRESRVGADISNRVSIRGSVPGIREGMIGRITKSRHSN
eukprot:GHVQ01007724.1.p1 GENE.GHVQ01007724.1~~GHVQ01007724.1.p1  ORF type:complete len:289 (+),score=56.58 GHVQ01007724.1:852-1718(+)